MIMSSKTIKLFIVFTLNCVVGVIPADAQFGIDWTGLATEAINESARSDVQKVFQTLSTINFSEAKLNSFRKEAEKMGLKNPTTVEALMLFEYGIRPLEVSPFPLLANQKISMIGDGAFRNIGNNVAEGIRIELAKNLLSDHLSESALKELNTIDADGTLGMLLKECMTPQLALLLNNRPECLLTLKQHPVLLKYGNFSLLPYFAYRATPHTYKFKKGTIPNISDWDFSILNNDVLLISSQSGEIGHIRRITDFSQALVDKPINTDSKWVDKLSTLSQIGLKSLPLSTSSSGGTVDVHFTTRKENLLIDIAEDPQLLNCFLPLSAIINFGSSTLLTDQLGRVVEVNFTPLKTKFTDTKKRQLKSKDILNAKGESGRKAFMLIPKNYGGTETWNNVFAFSDTKENKQNLKVLDKRLSELSKAGDSAISVKLSYNSTSDTPSTIQYYCGEELICTLKY